MSLYRRRAKRMLLIALVLSICVHLTGAALYGLLLTKLSQMLAATPQPRPTETIVTLSDSLTFDKRPHPNPHPRSHPHRTRVTPHVHPSEVRRVLVSPSVVARKIFVSPPVLKHALVHREQPRMKTVKEPNASLTREQLASFDRDFARTIAMTRSAIDPLRVPKKPPAAPKPYHFQFEGRIGDLRKGQGILTPIKAWRADGYDYYYVTYEVVFADGTYENGAVPWPIRYLPSEDPFANDAPRQIPLPPPLPGWTLPSGTYLGKVLRPYFPERRAAVN